MKSKLLENNSAFHNNFTHSIKMSIELQEREFLNKEYEVQYILDRKNDCDDNILYLIKWEGWPKSKATWEPLQNLLGDEEVQRMITEFDQNLLNKSKKWTTKQMDGTLNSWRKSDIKQDQNDINISNINDQTNYKCEVSFIDLQQDSFQQIPGKQQKSNQNFMDFIRKKVVLADSSKYPFEDPINKKQYISYRKIKSIEKIEKIGQDMKCFVNFTSKLHDPQWYALNLIRLFHPHILLEFYEEEQRIGLKNGI